MSGENAHSKELEISYDGEGDTLWMGNGRPGSIGFDITHGVLIPFFDTDGVDPNSRIPIGLLLFDAAELLAPHLPIEAIAHAGPVTYLDKLDLKISYDAAADTLWMGNSRPADISCPIVEDAIILYFQANSEAESRQGIKIPSGVMVYDAVKHIEPAILAELAELAAIGGTE